MASRTRGISSPTTGWPSSPDGPGAHRKPVGDRPVCKAGIKCAVERGDTLTGSRVQVHRIRRRHGVPRRCQQERRRRGVGDHFGRSSSPPGQPVRDEAMPVSELTGGRVQNRQLWGATAQGEKKGPSADSSVRGTHRAAQEWHQSMVRGTAGLSTWGCPARLDSGQMPHRAGVAQGLQSASECRRGGPIGQCTVTKKIRRIRTGGSREAPICSKR